MYLLLTSFVMGMHLFDLYLYLCLRQIGIECVWHLGGLSKNNTKRSRDEKWRYTCQSKSRKECFNVFALTFALRLAYIVVNRESAFRSLCQPPILPPHFCTQSIPQKYDELNFVKHFVSPSHYKWIFQCLYLWWLNALDIFHFSALRHYYSELWRRKGGKTAQTKLLLAKHRMDLGTKKNPSNPQGNSLTSTSGVEE